MEKDKCHICGKLFTKQNEIHILKVVSTIGLAWVGIDNLPMDVTTEVSYNVHKRCGELRQNSILNVLKMKGVKMSEDQASALLDLVDGNWTAFEMICSERQEDPEGIRSELEKIAMGD